MSDIPDLVEELPPDTSQLKAENIDLTATSNGPSTSVSNDRKVPITIITGYLGSGKSTLLQRIGQVSDKKLAIILNEFGDSASIEKSVTIQDTNKNEAVQEWLDLGNGCLCCTVKDNGVVAIEQLIESSKDKIDYILLETTGIADPAPIARMFWLDEGLSSNVYIDGVVTVLDAGNIVKCLDDIGGHWHSANNHLKSAQTEEELMPEELEQEKQQLQQGITTAHLQIALADTIVLNKIDVLEQDPNTKQSKIEEIMNKVTSINTTCPIHTTSYGDIDVKKLLDLHAFEANADKINNSKTLITNDSFHDNRIATITISFPFFTHENQFDKLESFLQYVLWEGKANGKDIEIHRLKGIMVHDHDVRVIQGVRETYDIITGAKLLDSIKENKLVFIGKNLNHQDLQKELENYI